MDDRSPQQKSADTRRANAAKEQLAQQNADQARQEQEEAKAGEAFVAQHEETFDATNPDDPTQIGKDEAGVRDDQERAEPGERLEGKPSVDQAPTTNLDKPAETVAAEEGDQSTPLMGDNATNPDVRPSIDAPVDAKPPAGDGPIMGDTGPQEIVTDPDSLVAKNEYLTAQVAEFQRQNEILKRDNAQLLDRTKVVDNGVTQWGDALGLQPGESPGERLDVLRSTIDAQQKRITQLENAIEVGPEGDPQGQVDELKGKRGVKAGKASAMPFWGHLLYVTALARLAGLPEYRTVPTVMYPGNGDEWTVNSEDVVVEGERTAHVVVQLKPKKYQQTTNEGEKRRLDLELSDALRKEKQTKEQLDAVMGGSRRDPVSETAYREAHKDAAERVRSLKADLRKVEADLDPEDTKTWRFTGNIHHVGEEA